MSRRTRTAAAVAVLVAVACGGTPPSVLPPPSPMIPPEGAVALEAPVAPRARPLLHAGPVGARPLARYLEVFRRPDSPQPKYVLDSWNPLRELVPMLVTGIRTAPGGERWVRLVFPLRPNGASGWVHVRDVELVRHRERIVVDLSDRTLEHFRGGDLVHRYSVGVGAPGTPTPTGRFYVWVKARQASPTGPYGAYVLGLSGFSEVLDWWPGEGRLAIHGTADPSDRGAAVSHGCVRVYNAQMLELRRVPLGTPVIIRR